MSGTVQSQIPLQFRPTPNIGPNFGQAIADAASVVQLQQQNQAIERANKLRGVLGEPGAFDPTGQIKPEVMSRVMSIDPNAGMQLQQNQLANQQKNLQINALKTKSAYDQADMLNNAYAPILEQYKTNIEKGMAEPQARAEAQKATTETNEHLAQGGTLPPDMVRTLPTKFDPSEFERKAMQTGQYMQWWKEQQQIKREGDVNKRSGTTTGMDTEGTPFILQPFGGPDGKPVAKYLDGRPVPPDKLTGAHIGKGSGPKPEDVFIDGRRGQALWNGRQWMDLEGNPIDGKVTRAGKQTQSETSGLTPDAVRDEAIRYNTTGVISAGFGGKADREAIMNEAARIRREQALTVADSISNIAGAKADTGSLGILAKQRDAISAYERGAEKEFDLAQKLIPKTPEPLNSQLLTQWVRSGERQFGDVPNAQFYTALTSALDEYAKVLSGAYGAAGSTDTMRRQALTIIPPGATTAQIKGLIQTIKQGMDFKRESYGEQIDLIEQRLRDRATSGGARPSQPTQSRSGSGADQGTQPPEPTEAYKDYLRKNPNTAESFDKRFGAGSAGKILGGGTPAAPTQQPTSQTPPAPAAGPRATQTAQPAKPRPLTAGMKPTDLTDGGIYETSKGPARWDKAQQKFFPVGQ